MTTTQDDAPAEATETDALDRIVVNFDQLTTAAAAIRRTADQMGTELTELADEITPLLESWQGATAALFTAKWATATDRTRTRFERLAGFADFLNAFAADYQQTDQELAEYIRTGGKSPESLRPANSAESPVSSADIDAGIGPR